MKDKMEKSVAKQAPSFSVWTAKHNKQVKPCPGCKAYIEKFDGCNVCTGEIGGGGRFVFIFYFLFLFSVFYLMLFSST